VQPLTGFASTLDEPYAKLRKLYTETEVPDRTVPRAGDVTFIDANQRGLSPEETFAEAAEDAPKPAKKKPSPLKEEE
jgi:hypothetical protein